MPHTTQRTRPLTRGRAAAAALLLALPAALASGGAPGIAGSAGALHGVAAFAGDPAPHLAEARKKLRQQDVKGTLAALDQAISADPLNADANILYQDVARDVLGPAALESRYKELAAKNGTDPVAAFLLARLKPAQEAIREFEKLATQFADSPWPLAGKARALEDLGRFGEASAIHDQAILRAGDHAARFMAYRAWGLERGGKFAEAAEAWKLVVAKDPADVAAKLGHAESLRRSGSIEEALAAFTELTKVAGIGAEPTYRIALCHLDANRFDEAQKSFENALAQDKGMIEALCGMSETILRKARTKAALEKRDMTEEELDPAVVAADKAAVVGPDSAYAHFTLGAAHEALGELDAEHLDTALKEYDAALERLPIPGPDKVRVLTAKSFVLLRLARWTEAQDAAEKAIGIDAKCGTAYGHAGHAMASQGKHKEAVEKFYKPGIKACPDDARLHHDMGIAIWEQKKPNDARKPLEDAKRLDPKNGVYRLSLGELYYELRRYKESAAELFEATELLPRSIQAWYSYGKSCYSAKNWEQCVEGFEKVCELDPESVDERLYLAVVYSEQLKNKEKAKEHAKKYLELGGDDPNLQSWIEQLIGTKTDKGSDKGSDKGDGK